MAGKALIGKSPPKLTEADQASLRHADHLYKNGTPLWTREMLEDIEAQVAENPQYYTIQRIDGSYGRKRNKRHDEPDKWAAEVIFYGHREVVNPTEEEWPYHHKLCSYMIYENAYIKPRYTAQELHDSFLAEDEKWRRSKECKYFEETLRLLEVPPTINKVVCFDLGNSIALRDYGFSSQHPVVMTLRRILMEKTGHYVELLAQDPAYGPDTKAVLEKAGFKVLGVAGVRGFLEVDENTVVFSVSAGTSVREIIADLARPAVIISHLFNSHDLSWDRPDRWILQDTEYNIRTGDCDSDTVRTKEMFETCYHDGVWVGFWTGHCLQWPGAVVAYVRKNKYINI